MFICIRKIHLRLAAGLLCGLSVIAAVFLQGGGNPASQPVFGLRQGIPVTVIVDAGHGGEDGGAVSAGGVKESDLNLSIALRVNDLLRFAGQRTDMTRREDISIHSESAETIRQKKASDLKNRAALVNGTENSVLLSIHQNSLPSSPETHGAQAFRNGQEGAELLAEEIQSALNTCVNTHRAKEARAIGSDVYLMKNIYVPGVLVECGFLSNPEETALLQTPEHQRKLTCAIVAGVLRSMAGEGDI